MMAEYVCMKCHYIGTAKRIKRGSTKIEFYGWLTFPLGLPYTLWRMFSKRRVCRHCGSSFLEPVTSPVGMRIIEKMSEEAGDTPPSFENFKADQQADSSPPSL